MSVVSPFLKNCGGSRRKEASFLKTLLTTNFQSKIQFKISRISLPAFAFPQILEIDASFSQP